MGAALAGLDCGGTFGVHGVSFWVPPGSLKAAGSV